MSRTSKDRGRHTKCPEGRSCDYCGPQVAAEHRDARHATAVMDGVAEHNETRDAMPEFCICNRAFCPDCWSVTEDAAWLRAPLTADEAKAVEEAESGKVEEW